MKTYENLELRYTSEENDNVEIWSCQHSWTLSKVTETFNDYDDQSVKKIHEYLTSDAHVAEGLNLIVRCCDD